MNDNFRFHIFYLSLGTVSGGKMFHILLFASYLEKKKHFYFAHFHFLNHIPWCVFRYVFDYHPGEVYWCTADIGWITGHSYITYGPLANGATSVLVFIYIVILTCEYGCVCLLGF